MARAALRFLAMTLASVSVSALAAPQWTVSEVAGPVTVMQGGASAAVRRGTILQPGAAIATGRGGRAVLVRGQEFVTVAADAKLRLPVAEKAAGVVQWLQDWGASLFRVEKKATPHFGVETPYLAAVVKGTTFRVTVSDKGAMLQVVEGAVEVATLDGAAHQLLRPGMVATIGAADRLRLNVDGANGRQTIDSPARAEPVAREDIAAEPAIVAAIADDGGSAAATTGGLVHGDLGGKLVAMFVADQRAAASQQGAGDASNSVATDAVEVALAVTTGDAAPSPAASNTAPAAAASATAPPAAVGDTASPPAADLPPATPPVAVVAPDPSPASTGSSDATAAGGGAGAASGASEGAGTAASASNAGTPPDTQAPPVTSGSSTGSASASGGSAASDPGSATSNGSASAPDKDNSKDDARGKDDDKSKGDEKDKDKDKDKGKDKDKDDKDRDSGNRGSDKDKSAVDKLLDDVKSKIDKIKKGGK